MKSCLLPVLALCFAACQKQGDTRPPVAAQGSLVGTWNLQTERDLTTELGSQQVIRDYTYTFTNSQTVFGADGTVTVLNNGLLSYSGQYVLAGSTITYTLPQAQKVPDRIVELTDTRLVLESTSQSSTARSVATTTATR